MLNEEEIIEALSTWIREDHATKVAAVQVPIGNDAPIVKRAIENADAEPVWISMGGVAGVDIASAAQTPIAVTFKKKVIVVYEFDAIVSNDPSTCAAISAAIRKNRVPVILVANSFRSKGSEVPKGHAFFTLGQNDVIPIYTKNTKGIDGAKDALRGVEAEYRGDGIALGGVFDNYLNHAATPIDAAFRIAESFSSADIAAEGMRRCGCFDDPYSFLPVSTASHVFRELGATPAIGTFGTVWSKTNAMYAKMNSSRVVERAMVDAGSRQPWHAAAGIDMVRCMVSAALARDDVREAADVADRAGLTHAALLATMRLWKSKYTLATHAKIRKISL
jgi:hypothetical protein